MKSGGIAAAVGCLVQLVSGLGGTFQTSLTLKDFREQVNL